ncbi:ATP-binding protein [Candidatus Palauibacter sp.]|uniref:ATP-binding protein n=1 Tax=Candidatus Palauibacter sp. TaxID=3101350 RepID=UPI003D0C5971
MRARIRHATGLIATKCSCSTPAGSGRGAPAGRIADTSERPTRYYRLSRLLDELTLARGDGTYPKVVQRLARIWLLILDDLGLASLSGQSRHDLLEILDDRYARRGTLLASQLPAEHWHDVVGDPNFGDAILDRLLNNAHRITLKGGSMRRLYDSTRDADSKDD